MQEKLRRRIASVNVKVLNPPRPGKKCLVLDIDYTLFDLVRAPKLTATLRSTPGSLPLLLPALHSLCHIVHVPQMLFYPVLTHVRLVHQSSQTVAALRLTLNLLARSLL